MKKYLIFFFAFFVFSINVSFSMTILDWKEEGDGLITFDESSNLEWLDPIKTFARAITYPTLTYRFEPGGEFEGFRLATLDEVLGFWSGFGLPTVASWGGGTAEEKAVDNEIFDPFLETVGMLSLFGDENFRPYYFSFDNLLDDGKSGISLLIKYTDGYYNGDNIAIANYSYVYDTDNYQNLGAWLVRDVAPVPEPSTLVLLGAGLAGLLGYRRFRK